MNITELLQKVIDYIEENLKCEISISELASISGYSIYHFCHVFCSYVGMPVALYITRRKLYHAIFEMQNNKMIEIVHLYGFDTYSGFYKAFRREFGCSPKKYLKLHIVKKPIRIDLIKEGKFMLSQFQIRQLLSNWNINTKQEIGNIFKAGGAAQVNNAWMIGDKYVLKIGKNISGLRVHIEISKALEKDGMLSAYPIKTISNKDFIMDEDRFYVLTNRVPGEFLKPIDRYQSNNSLCNLFNSNDFYFLVDTK